VAQSAVPFTALCSIPVCNRLITHALTAAITVFQPEKHQRELCYPLSTLGVTMTKVQLTWLAASIQGTGLVGEWWQRTCGSLLR
jgi:hypothetical protein